MYEFEARVKYSEIDNEQNLKWTAMMNYLQDCSTFQSEDLGIGINYLLDRNLAWVVNYWQVDVIRMPRFSEKIIVGTLPYSLRGFIGLRNFYIKSAETGEYLVKANSMWTLVDLRTVKPARVDQEMYSAYEIGEKIDMEYADRKIKLEGEGEAEADIIIMKHHLDTNNHVNNVQYIQMALDYVPEDCTITRMRIEYRKAAYKSDIIKPVVYRNEGELGVMLGDESGEPYVRCAFTYGK